ncbi:BTE_collapsed_G0027740.mRNA.1.CDS.1 [Saccharomyces cerevisiae]|nr:BTE_collapsed_G0027740.mRNA.1.CDS.1 [Saccharomyces cerevisiae]
MGSCNQCRLKKTKCNYFPDLGNCLECETSRTKCTFSIAPNYLKRTLDNVDQIQLSKTLSLRKVSPTAQFTLQDDFDTTLHSKQEYEVDLVENLVHPHGHLLVEIFFKLIHPFLPILHERVFLEKYSRSYRELTAPLLASIYSLALQYWDFHPALLGFPKPDVTAQLNNIALETFYARVGRPKLNIIQTGLLILQCRSECHNNWVLCSSVVALAEEFDSKL